jgi:hypothetical protein
MDLSNKKIIVGGWPAFAEASGVNEKEPVETFDWIPSESDKFFYNDMRTALDSVEGSREWLKAYVFDEARDSFPYNTEIGRKIVEAMSNHHSGASASCILVNYSAALKDWDTFVLKIKVYQGKKEFKRQQVPYEVVTSILDLCKAWLSHEGPSPRDQGIQDEIFMRCAMLGLSGKVTEIRSILLAIQKDYEELIAEEKRVYEEEKHGALMESIKFLYKVPIRWFDTPSGCTLMPSHPTRITRRAMAEMETLFPGYDKHIENVLVAMGSPKKPSYTNGAGGIFSNEGREVWEEFLRQQKVIA